MIKSIKEIIIDAWAYIANADARKLSSFKYPNGAGMSVLTAKKSRLI